MSEQAIFDGNRDLPAGLAACGAAVETPERLAASVASQSAKQSSGAATEISGRSASRVPWTRVLHELGGEAGVLAELAAAFRQEGPQLIGQMRSAAAAGNASALWQAAHTLKGTLQIFHTDDLLLLARQVEVLARAGHLAGAGELLPQLEAGVAELCAEMAAYLPAAS